VYMYSTVPIIAGDFAFTVPVQSVGLLADVNRCTDSVTFVLTAYEQMTAIHLSLLIIIKRRLISRRNVPGDITRARKSVATEFVVAVLRSIKSIKI